MVSNNQIYKYLHNFKCTFFHLNNNFKDFLSLIQKDNYSLKEALKILYFG